MRKISYEDFVNGVDYEDENVDAYEGIVVLMEVVAVVVEVTMIVAYMAIIKNGSAF